MKKLTVIEIPLYLKFDSPIRLRDYSSEDRQVRVCKEINIPVQLRDSNSNNLPETIIRLVQYLSVLINRLMGKSRYDIAIAEDPIMAFLAIGLHRMGIIKHVVFQSHSYTAPERNRFYKFIDYYVTRNSDVVWALSNRLVRIRKNLGAKHVIHTPICIRDDVVNYINNCYEEKENAVVYIGALNKDKGVDVLLRLIPSLVKIFDKVYIVGKGQYEEAIKKLSRMSENKIEYLGRLSLKQSVWIAKKSLLGLVLTKPSFELLTTDPMKPKIYIASHTPLVVPKYFELSYFVKKFSAGLVISNLSKNYIIEHISRLTKEPDDYIRGAISMAKYFNYWRCSMLLKDIIEKTLYFLEVY